ncbi:hypothetical protein [Microlunatus ginsengisoli]|uniref:Uncharacterized protein n=1 Tax=Microlunatus ginsengisoli TaxID=363863 RepID=A0ABP7A966_9ACTN
MTLAHAHCRSAYDRRDGGAAHAGRVRRRPAAFAGIKDLDRLNTADRQLAKLAPMTLTLPGDGSGRVRDQLPRVVMAKELLLRSVKLPTVAST